MSLSQETTVDHEEYILWVPSKQDVHWPMERLRWDNNDVFKCKFHVPVDESTWTHPFLRKESFMINLDPDAFDELTNQENMKCAKRVVNSYLYQNIPDESEDIDNHEAYKSSIYIKELGLGYGQFPVYQNRKELLDAFDEMDFHEAYKSIIDIEQSLVTKKPVHRIHWFMALAVSNLIKQYGQDQQNNGAFNVFDVLSCSIYPFNPFIQENIGPLSDSEIDDLLKNKFFRDYSTLSVKTMKARALALYEIVTRKKYFSLEIALTKAENRDFLLSMYRLSSVYYSLKPGYFSNTLENYPLFWQVYAELKGRIVIVSDLGRSKFFAPFGFEGALTNYCSSLGVLKSGDTVYSAKQLAQSSIGVESFFCSTFKTYLLKDERSQVFCPVMKKITARSLKLCKKDFGKLTDDKESVEENEDDRENEARTEEEDSSSKGGKANDDKAIESNNVGDDEAFTEGDSSLCDWYHNTMFGIGGFQHRTSDNQYSFFLRRS